MLGSKYRTPLLFSLCFFKKNSEVVNFLILLLVQGIAIMLSFLSVTITVAFFFFYCRVATVSHATANWSLQIKLLSFQAIQH